MSGGRKRLKADFMCGAPIFCFVLAGLAFMYFIGCGVLLCCTGRAGFGAYVIILTLLAITTITFAVRTATKNSGASFVDAMKANDKMWRNDE